MTRVIDGPAYRTFDSHKGRWVVGREACIDALVRKALPPKRTHLDWGWLRLESTNLNSEEIAVQVRQWWLRSVFR